jgi:uncharacterized protein YozE (UPF0346 family)
MKRLTKESLQERSNQIHNSQYLILGEYVNNSTPIEILHLVCDSIFRQQPNNHLQGKGCMKCSGREKGSKEELQRKSNEKHNSQYEILGNYINNSTNIKIKHLACGTTFETLPCNHLSRKGCCTTCFASPKKTKEQLQIESDEIHNNEYEIIGNYINTDTKILIKHKVCNSEFYQTPDKHLHNNKCPICYGKHRLTKNIIQERSNSKYNSEYTIIGDYINNSTPILIKHNICGTEYEQSPANHLKDRVCFKCRGIQSNGEKIIDNYLSSKNIKFQFNKSVGNCNFNNKKLRFDFFIPLHNLCIEYDGEQHFKPISKFGGEERYRISQIRDSIKDKWCIENNIKLIRISYKESIIDKLDNYFNI